MFPVVVVMLLPAVAVAASDWTWSSTFTRFGKSFSEMTEYPRTFPGEMRCHSCTTINASDIVSGSGIHPGVYIASLLSSSIPVSSDCASPYEKYDLAPACEDGVCIKINYTARHSGRMDVLRACIPRSQGVFKQMCTRFASSQAHGTWCVCSDDLCNVAPRPSHYSLTALAFLISSGILLRSL